MITPIDYQVEDFLSADTDARSIACIKAEALKGSPLIDNLILLGFCEMYTIQKVLKEKYKLYFAWLNMDPTPAEYKDIAERHHVIIQHGKTVIVYIPLGQAVDDTVLQLDIPNFTIEYRYIADCNFRLLKSKLDLHLISERVAPFRPLLVFKRLIMDCMSRTGTDLHFESNYESNHPMHFIRYRIKRELCSSAFKIDYNMMHKIAHAVINDLSSASAQDLDSPQGVITSIRDLFKDGSTDLRLTAIRVSAGYYIEVAIQNINTTTRKVDELGFPDCDVDTIRQIAKRRTGLTLVTGEMRSGKNTTIFAMLNEMDATKMRIIEYSNPIENHMGFPQIDYHGDIDLLQHYMRIVKKQDVDIAVLNEIPNSEVAFAVRDLVNSAIGVITTTHINRAWHLPNKLREFFSSDYKTIISQLNAVINHKMFRRWGGTAFQKRTLEKERGPFELFCYKAGVRQYFVPDSMEKVKFELQPMVEILVLSDAMKTAMLNFDEIWRAEQMIQSQLTQAHATLENKVAEYVNKGIMSLDEMRLLY